MILDRRTFASMAISIIAASRCSALPAKSETAASTAKASKLITAARRQIGVTVNYDPAYTGLSFPNGDVPRSKGVCTDVVVRAYRDAFGLDLQSLVNADMKANFGVYPKIWGLRGTDKNIDHRRVPNLQIFLKRQGASLPVSGEASDWEPGDIFTCMIGGRLPHIGIISDKKADSTPLVIHNIGGGTREENMLFAHKLTGHYRWQLA
jgi:uncharacterized protein